MDPSESEMIPIAFNVVPGASSGVMTAFLGSSGHQKLPGNVALPYSTNQRPVNLRWQRNLIVAVQAAILSKTTNRFD